jgi:hemoglobin-like flavoprotein
VNSFYKQLFKSAPELRDLFSQGTLSTQREMLMGALSLVVKAANDDFSDMNYFTLLGQRHREYAFDLKYFAVFSDCLLRVLEDAMEQEWSPDMKEQWSFALQQVTQAMIKGMQAEPTDSPVGTQ